MSVLFWGERLTRASEASPVEAEFYISNIADDVGKGLVVVNNLGFITQRIMSRNLEREQRENMSSIGYVKSAERCWAYLSSSSYITDN